MERIGVDDFVRTTFFDTAAARDVLRRRRVLIAVVTCAAMLIAGLYLASMNRAGKTVEDGAGPIPVEKIAALQKNVSEAEKAVRDFRDAHGVPGPGTDAAMQAQIGQLGAGLSAARNQAADAERKYEQLSAVVPSPDGTIHLPEGVSSSAFDTLRDHYEQRSAQLADLGKVYGPKYPTIVRLRSELARLRELMADEVRSLTAQTKADRDIDLKSVATLEGKLAALRRQATASDAARTEMRQLERKADAARATLDEFVRPATGRRAPSTAQTQWATRLLFLPASAALGRWPAARWRLPSAGPGLPAARPEHPSMR